MGPYPRRSHHAMEESRSGNVYSLPSTPGRYIAAGWMGLATWPVLEPMEGEDDRAPQGWIGGRAGHTHTAERCGGGVVHERF